VIVGSIVAVASVAFAGFAVNVGVLVALVGWTDGIGVWVAVAALVGWTDGIGVWAAVAALVGVRVGMSGSGVGVGGMAVGGGVGGLVAFCANRFSIAGHPMPNNAARISRAPALTSRSPVQSDNLLLCTPPPHD
jgi:hypothetical protein